MSSSRIIPSLPRIKAKIGHIPQRLKSKPFENPQGRLEVLRQMITRLIREERYEVKANRAEEARPYVERLVQLGVYRGLNDPYTKEMYDWWLLEKDLVDKMEQVLIPRFTDMPEPYTNIFRLPKMRYQYRRHSRLSYYTQSDIAVLELKGNPFPEIQPLEDERIENLQEYIQSRLGVH